MSATKYFTWKVFSFLLQEVGRVTGHSTAPSPPVQGIRVHLHGGRLAVHIDRGNTSIQPLILSPKQQFTSIYPAKCLCALQSPPKRGAAFIPNVVGEGGGSKKHLPIPGSPTPTSLFLSSFSFHSPDTPLTDPVPSKLPWGWELGPKTPLLFCQVSRQQRKAANAPPDRAPQHSLGQQELT